MGSREMDERYVEKERERESPPSPLPSENQQRLSDLIGPYRGTYRIVE